MREREREVVPHDRTWLMLPKKTRTLARLHAPFEIYFDY